MNLIKKNKKKMKMKMKIHKRELKNFKTQIGINISR
jgi:hypothetical protein